MVHSIDWKILLIDDDKDIRQVISIVLEDAGFNVATASNGEQGINICKQFSPQIVITDMRMPGMNGIQVLEALKKIDPAIEVIVLTAFGEMDQAAKALKLDASDYINKPISDEVLFIVLKRAQNRYLKGQQQKEQMPPKSLEQTGRSVHPQGLQKNFVKGSIDGALACDEKEMITALNSTMAGLLGYEENRVVGKMTLSRLFDANEKADLDEKLSSEYVKDQAGWENRISIFETFILDRSGNSIPVQMSVAMVADQGKKQGMICFFKDLREQVILCSQWVHLLDQINIGAFTIDFNRRITSFNTSMQAMTELKESEVLGKDCRDVFKEISCHAGCPFHLNVKCDNRDLSVEIKDQSDRKHLITRLSAPLYTSGNRITGCLTLFQDHAALAELISRINYKERGLKTILDNLDIGIFTVNRGRYTTFFNTAAEVITGYNRRQVLGRPCSIIFGKTGNKEEQLLNESMTLGESRSGNECEIISRQGEVIPIRADYIPLHSDQGKIVGCIGTIQDLTLSHQFKAVVSNRYTFHSMIGKDPVMQKIFKTVEVAAKSSATILIEGETGTGKDLLAKVIHSSSSRADMPLIKVNCAALPETLLESELFGYVKGAFTGADRDKPGRFQEADNGTIFLDEIGDLPLSLQAKFLRVIEDREFYPLGGRNTIKVDVRIISATNRGLRELVNKRQFREDLFYRLNVMQVELPALKQRKDDIPLIIRHVIRKLCSARAVSSHEISKNAMKILLNHDYPGNVRELQNILEHALIVCQGDKIEPEHLPMSLQNRFRQRSRSSLISENGQKIQFSGPDDQERRTIIEALKNNNWNKTRTASSLGIDRTTLWRKMKTMNITSG